MKSIQFEETNVIISEHQEEYNSLPALINREDGTVTFCMKLDSDEVMDIYRTGKLWVKVMTFNQPLQPMAFSTDKKDFINDYNL